MSASPLQDLKRWSCTDRELPSVESIRDIHVYDFDNTLFNTPLPNTQLWHGSNISTLQSDNVFNSGGWWHNPAFLAAVGEGVEKEEHRAWAGWWNETIVELVQSSMEQQNALTILLTGRAQTRFAGLIQRIVKSKGLEFNLIGLKPPTGPDGEKFSSTMNFKQAFLTKVLQTYFRAEEMTIYEDRPKHVSAFEAFCAEVNRTRDPASSDLRPLSFNVVAVAPGAKFLDPLTETVEVQKMLNEHNAYVASGNAPPGSTTWILKRSVLFAGYLIDPSDSEKLPAVANLTPATIQKEHLRTLANNVMITPRALTDTLKQKVGGIGAKVKWKVVGLGVYENKVWAARVEPVPITAKFWVESNVPHVVLARRQDARPGDASRITQWSPIPPDKQIEFNTVVGEKVLLRLDQRRPGAQPAAEEPNKGTKRPFDNDDFPPLGAQPPKPQQQAGSKFAPAPPQPTPRGGHFGRGRGGGGAGGGGGRGRGGGGRGPGGGMRGKKGQAPYRSLDDQSGRGRFGGNDGAMDEGGLTY